MAPPTVTAGEESPLFLFGLSLTGHPGPGSARACTLLFYHVIREHRFILPPRILYRIWIQNVKCQMIMPQRLAAHNSTQRAAREREICVNCE